MKQGGCLGEGASLAEEPGQDSSFSVDPPVPAPVGRGGKRAAASAGRWAPSRNRLWCGEVSTGLGGSSKG